MILLIYSLVILENVIITIETKYQMLSISIKKVNNLLNDRVAFNITLPFC